MPAQPISIVNSAFYMSLRALQRGNYGEKPFVEALSGLKGEAQFRILQEERTCAYFHVQGAPGYGVNVESVSGSLDSLGSARFNLRYSSKHPAGGQSLCTASRLEDIFQEAYTKNLNIEEVSEALEEELAPDTWSKHHRTFYAPVTKIISILKDPETETEMDISVPGTLIVDLRETPKYAHDRYCTEFNLEIYAKLTPEFPKSEPTKKPSLGAHAGASLGSRVAVKHP